jgi:3-isopropylmalate dehydrogenase
MAIHQIALVVGDGAAPEMMEQATRITQAAAHKYGHQIIWSDTPAGWNAWEYHGDTMPKASLELMLSIGTVFFGGVGDPELDSTLGVQHPHMRPEARCLLALREQMGLLLNYRPAVYRKSLQHLALVRPEMIPDEGITQLWIRFLLEDSYFGNTDFLSGKHGEEARQAAETIGAKLKHNVTGNEEWVVDIAYYQKVTIERYVRAAFVEAQARKLPVISIDKANVMSRYHFWRLIVAHIGATEFPDVKLSHQLVDSGNTLLFTPQKLHGVIVCGNEHGDILSDGALAALGGMGLMHSSAINPVTRAAMFESGAGTAPTLAGQDIANPLGRILTGGMMLRHLGMIPAAQCIEDAVWRTLDAGYCTRDLAGPNTPADKIVGTRGMGDLIMEAL